MFEQKIIISRQLLTCLLYVIFCFNVNIRIPEFFFHLFPFLQYICQDQRRLIPLHISFLIYQKIRHIFLKRFTVIRRQVIDNSKGTFLQSGFPDSLPA